MITRPALSLCQCLEIGDWRVSCGLETSFQCSKVGKVSVGRASKEHFPSGSKRTIDSEKTIRSPMELSWEYIRLIHH